MSLGAVVSHTSRRKPSDGQFVADLAGLFERRHIAIGEPHVCEQFEILLTTSDGFRGQLFTLCTAISHMADHDLSGDELLDLVARALRTESLDGSELPQPLRENFLSGFEAWQNRGMSGEDEWPPRKKPVASETRPVSIPVEPPVAAESNVPVRPGGVPTLQEALQLARMRGGDKPLRPEVIPDPESTDPADDSDSGANAAAIQQLNTLLHEIEQRMKQLRPQLVTPDPVPPPPAPAVDYRKLDILKSGTDDKVFNLSLSAPVPELPQEEDAAFLARHPYLLNKRPTPVIEASGTLVPETQDVPQAESELRLIPRSAATLDEVQVTRKPGPPTVVVAESIKLKTYLAIAVLAGVVLVGAPLSAVVAYRYMHPLYIYETKPELAPEAPQPTDDPNAAPSHSAPSKKSKSHRKPAAPAKPPVRVWPFPEQ